jgi:hypothetical protein
LRRVPSTIEARATEVRATEVRATEVRATEVRATFYGLNKRVSDSLSIWRSKKH